jgi:TM2 domain-containing membrane protein YozV/predicted RNA-binding Zn-ribbon protein involved in translation (DUF1610 family)
MNELIRMNQHGGINSKSADQKHCFSCGQVLHHSALQCPNCGAQQPAIPPLVIAGTPQFQANQNSLAPNHVYCRGCGAAIHQSAKTCPKCGAPQSSTSDTPESGKRTSAAIMAIFLGAFGIHKFYTGKIFAGFIYLLFFWTFIPGIIGFCEGIYYLTLSDEEFDRKVL